METTWEPATKDNLCHIVIGFNITPVNGRIGEKRMQLWQQLYERYPIKYE